MPLRAELRLYDASGERQPLPDPYIADWDFELLERGGCGVFTLKLWAKWGDEEIPALPEVAGTFEVWFHGVPNYPNGIPAYRGTVDRVVPVVDKDPRQYACDGMGQMNRLGLLLINAAYAKPYGADVSEIYGWISDYYLVGEERLGEFAAYIEGELGYTIDRADFFDTDVRAAFDKLAESSEDLLIWGWDVTPDGADRLYVRKRGTSVTQEEFRFRAGKDLTYYEQPDDLASVANGIRLTGGQLKAPNMVYNSSFELPDLPGEGKEGNLIVNPSFDSPGTGWTYNPSEPSVRQTSNGEPGEYARTGGKFAELDNAGDWVRQAVDLDAPDQGAGTPYLLQIHYATQNGLTPGTIHVTLEEMNGSTVLNTLVDPVLGADNPACGVVTATARSYQEKRWYVQLSSNSTNRLRVTLEYDSGGSVLVDDVFLFVADQLVQDGWTFQERGSGVAEIDWACRETPYHGAYCVRVTTTGCGDGTDNDNVWIQLTNDQWLNARDATGYRVRAWVRTFAAQKVRLGIQRQKGGGGSDRKWSSKITTNGTGEWELLESTITSGPDANAVRPIIEFRTDGTFYLDAVQLFESGIEDGQPYNPGDHLDQYFRVGEWRDDLQVHASTNTKVQSAARPFAATDVGKTLRVMGGTGWANGDYPITAYDGSAYVTLSTSPAATGTSGGQGVATELPGLSDAVLLSIRDYGLREKSVSAEEILTREQAMAYATGYLNRFAVPLRQSQLTLDPCDVFLRFVDADAEATPLGQVAVSGLSPAPPNQNPVRIVYRLGGDGQVRCEVDLTNRRPDQALLLRDALSSRGRGGGSGGGGGGGGGTGSSGGGIPVGEGGSAPMVQVDGVDIAARGTVNYVSGPGVTITPTDQGEDAGVVDLEFSAGEAGVYQLLAEKGQPDGYASLGSDGKVPSGQLPAGLPSTNAYTRFDGWRRVDIGANASSSTFLTLEGYDGLDYPDPMAYAGTAYAVGVALNTTLGSGQKYEVELYRSTDGGATFTATGIKATVDGDAGTTYAKRFATVTSALGVGFNAGDVFDLRDKKTGISTGRTSRAYYLVRFG